jgi:photosystem II stability/assembly factor-like uncharacterized protein
VDALRASLTEHARHAPAADALAERIIAAVDTQPPARDLHRVPLRGWRTWALPLVAAASVAAVVGGALAIEHFSTQADKSPAAGSPTILQSAAPTGLPSAPTSAPSTTPSTPISLDTSTLHGVDILDLTFAGVDDGWALASANCVTGSGRCTALLRTTDGKTWKSMPGAAFRVAGVQNCADPCVTSIRFADDKTGYAFGPTALFMTTDGGRNWTRQPGGAQFLETLDSNVVRVVADSPSGCPGPCNVRVQTAAIGSTSWTTAQLRPGGVSASSLAFSRGGSDAYVLAEANPAGGASNETSTLYRSTDDGRTWKAAGEPCPQLQSAEVDSTAIAAAPGGRAAVLCRTRQAPQRYFVATSTDHGATFAGQPGTTPPATAEQLTGDPTTVLVTAGSGLSRSPDGGNTWQRVPGVTGQITFVGFESDQVGRAVGDSGRAIWTTRDGGVTWSKVAFQ